MRIEQDDTLLPSSKEHYDEQMKRLFIWNGLRPGDEILVSVDRSSQFTGIVESKTPDGYIIWVRDSLNERRLFDFCEVEYLVRLE